MSWTLAAALSPDEEENLDQGVARIVSRRHALKVDRRIILVLSAEIVNSAAL